ncbi:MAG: hypothetical protein H7843_08785 [Nitrospirota bacterium]
MTKLLKAVGLVVALMVLSFAGVFIQQTASGAMSDNSSTVMSAQKGGCLNCHDGIEDINPKMTQAFYKTGKAPGHECSICHAGDPNAKEKDSAHKGMFINPADLKVVEKTCGNCHEDHVSRVEKSLMANSQGEIAGTLYARGFTKDKDSNYAMTDKPIKATIPAGQWTLNGLEPIPDSSTHISVEMLRKVCIKCHLRADGQKLPKNYRSAGCAACHMLTSADGKYSGSDPTMKDKPWRAAAHRITVQIPSEQCVRCHKGGNRIGVSFTAELPGHEADIHYQRGMHCIDCHTTNEIHGDGNIYMRKWQAVKIKCTSCHGVHNGKPPLTDATDQKLKNVREYIITEGDKERYVYKLTSKVSGKVHVIPTVSTLMEKEKLPVAMQIAAHLNKMECAACHSTKIANCYACHFKVDRTKQGKDIITGKESDGAWSIVTDDFENKWKRPPLSIHQSGKTAPNQLGCAVHITEISKDNMTTMDYAVNPGTNGKTLDGYTAFSRISVGNAHTTQRSAMRTCDDCHNDPATLGMGGKPVETFKSGRKLFADPDRFIDEKGKQQLTFSQIGQRPFNESEIIRIRRVSQCTGCHLGANAGFWNNFRENYKWAQSTHTSEHKKMINTKLK